MSRLLDVHNFVGDKMRWQQQVLIDTGLSLSAKVVGCLIAHDLNVERGAAWRAQENMALALGVSLSTVRRGIAELAGLGYLAIRRSRGRGKTQQYSAMLIDGAEAHDSIDKVIQARRGTAAGDAEKVSPLTLDGPEKVARVTGHEPERVARVNIGDAERVSPVTGKGVTGERQYLEEPFTPPFPPARRERDLGESRANRVRGRWADEPSHLRPTFQSLEVREVARKRLGEEGVRSWLDASAWDPAGRVVVCPLGFTADHLAREIGRDLKAIGVTVVADKKRFSELMRAGRPVDSDRSIGAQA
jgi:hypothetical protein